MERNPYAINVESNPYQIELAGHETGQVTDTGASSAPNEYASSNAGHFSRPRLPTRVSISRQGKALVKGVQDRGGCRLFICLLGVGLCWLASFQVASTFVELIFTPPSGGPQVKESWDQFGAQVNLERLRNVECINASLALCTDTLQGQFDSMGFDVDVIALQNSYLVANATTHQQKCADAQSRKIASIQVFKVALDQNSKSVLWNMTNNCSNATRSNLNSMYSNPSMTANQATTATSQYGNSNDVTWAQAYDSMKARAAYDQAYWANKTDAVQQWYTSQGLEISPPNLPNFTTDFNGFNTDLSTYWQCATLSSTPPCPYPGQGLRAQADQTAATFKSKYNSLLTSINTQRNLSQAYLDAAQVKIQGYSTYATNVDKQLKDMAASIDKATNCGQPCSDLKLNYPQAPSVNLPSSPGLGGYTFDDVPAIDLDSLMNGLDFGNQTAAVRSKLAAMSNNVNGAVTQWGSQIGVGIDGAFNWNASLGVDFGYNPPPVGINVSGVTNLTAWYVNQTNGQLSDAAARLSPGGGTGGSSNRTAEALSALKLGVNSLSTTDYTYASLGGSIDLDVWFLSMNWFRFFVYFLDYAWRIYYSGRIFIRYWYGAAGTMPPLDIRSYRTQKNTPLNVRIARYATHPFVLFSGALVLGIMAVSVIIGLYIPMLQDYTKHCVDSNPTTPGQDSFVGNNVYAAAFNAAVLEGNRDLSHGLNDYDTSRANLCGSKQQDAQNAFANQQYQLKIVRDNMQSVATLLDQMEFCTSMDTWTQLMPNDFQHYTNLPNPNNSTGFHVPRCSMADFDALGSLLPPPINCSALPPCATQCGVDTSVVQGVSHRASCETQYYVHTTILQTVCTVVVFIFWNICRTLLLDGLVRVYWKNLVQGTGLNFYATCNQEGRIDQDTEDKLAVAIKQSDQSYKRMGIIYIVMSFLLNIPYIVFCVLLNIDIAYH